MLIPLLFSHDDIPAQYEASVLNTSPFFVGKLNETSGTTLVDSSGNGYNGIYSGVLLNQYTAPMRTNSAQYDGSTAYSRVNAAGFQTAFDLDEGTALIWVRMASASVWTDSTIRYVFRFEIDANNVLYIRKSATNNTLSISREADNASLFLTHTISSTNWFSLLVSWSVAGDSFELYVDGGLVDSTDTLAANTNSSPTAYIGAANTTPSNVHNGFLSYLTLWASPVDADKLALATV